MTNVNRDRLCLALNNAAEMIRGHAEVGISPSDVNEEDEKGLKEYVKSCERAAKCIERLSKKYEQITKSSQSLH